MKKQKRCLFCQLFSSKKLFSEVFPLILLFLSFASCDVNINDNLPPCPSNDLVATPPYDSSCWHPGGEFIGFNYTPLIKITYPNGEQCQGAYEWDSGKSSFWLINSDGTNLRRIFSYKLQTPVWSPDGEWIAFVVPIGDERHICKMRFNGETFDTTTIVQLTTEGRNFLPSWSPDGQWIAYDSNADTPGLMKYIWKMKSGGSQKTRIAYDPTKGEIRMPSWSKDCNKIVHLKYSTEFISTEVFTVDINGGNIIRLANNTKDDRCPDYVFGNNIVYWSDANLLVMDSLGANIKQLSNQRIDDFLSVSPSGDKVVYALYEPNKWTYENGTLWIIDLITGEKRQLTFNPKPTN
jgi:Tol biopolymer transport system component